MSMENDPNTAHTPATKGDLDTLEGKIVGKMEHILSEHTKSTEQLLADQANVILEAVGELMEKKLDEKFDPVITKLDGIMKGVEALQQENTIGAEQLRRHEDRIAKLETAPA